MQFLKSPASSLALAAILLGCGNQESIDKIQSKSTGCQSGTALIGVQDGYLTRYCGCTEASGTTTDTSGTLSCTVSKNTSVVFQYVGAKLRHQIVADDV